MATIKTGRRPGALARAATETELSSAIREATNLHPGVRLRRNNSGRLQDRNGMWVQFGQGIGSPDLMGAVTVYVQWDAAHSRTIARCFHLEVKKPGEKPTEDQLAWHREARSRGEFVAVVTSVGEALDALERCKQGLLE